MAIIADKILLVGGPYDGCVADFGMGRATCMHDPSGERPDALYAYNLEFDLHTGDIHIRSANFEPGWSGELI